MGVHVANGSVRTSNKGVVRQVFNFAIGAAGAVGAVTQAGANFVSSVTRSAKGVYTIQFNQLYPVRIIFANAHVATPAVTDAIRIARVDSDSYSAATGSLVVHVATTGALAEDPADGAQIHVEVVYVDQTTGIAS